MKNQAYFIEAQNFANERFSGVDGFDNFTDSMNFTDDMNAAGVNMHQYNSKTSEPYELEVANANLVTTNATVFNSYVNRTAANNGNPVGITVSSATTNVTYNGLLGQTEHKNFECGMIYIEVVSGSTAGLTATMSLTTLDADGESHTRQLRPKKDPRQQQNDVLEFYNTFKINGFTNIVIPIPATTTMRYSFYPSATVDSGRKLGNVHEIKDYKGPKISQPQQISLSAGAAKALGGR
jgi:hypothetical protein